jgi:hypothetical protein
LPLGVILSGGDSQAAVGVRAGRVVGDDELSRGVTAFGGYPLVVGFDDEVGGEAKRRVLFDRFTRAALV